jgi:hypothetical protein
MRDTEIRELDAAQRVREFASAHQTDFPNGSHGAAVTTTLVNTISQVQKQAAAQDAANLDRQEATEEKQVAINTLLTLMRAINSTARSIDNIFPGMADQFKMVRGNNDQAILNRARAYITEATPIQERFTDRGLPATFLDDLQAAIDAVEEADNHQSAALIAQTAATAGVAAALKQMRAAMKEFAAIARNIYRNDPETLAAFKSASRVERAPKKAKKAAPPSS